MASDKAGNTLKQARLFRTRFRIQEFEDSVGKGDIKDHYRFDIPRSRFAGIALDQMEGDADLFLLNSKGRVLARSATRRRGASEFINITLVDPGTYYILVRARKGSGTDYRLSTIFGATGGGGNDDDDDGGNGGGNGGNGGGLAVPFKDLNPGVDSSNPQFLTVVDDTLFFAATNGRTGVELWKSDGTSRGTVLVKDINTGSTGDLQDSSSPSDLVAFNGELYFFADNGSSGKELWKSDGTSAGTVLVRDINAGSEGSDPSELVVVGDTLFFAADDGNGLGKELWKSDGTRSGTTLVENINLGSGSSNPFGMVDFNGELFFSADRGDVNPIGRELWRSDGTLEGTNLVRDIQLGAEGSNPFDLVPIGDTLYFAATTVNNGRELWQSDGTLEGTSLVTNIASGSDSSFPSSLANFNDVLYFQATNGISGFELWRSDGTADGTVRVKDIFVGGESSFPTGLVQVGNLLYFAATTEASGRELWRTNGTSTGTIRVRDINPGKDSSSPLELVDFNGELFFTAEDGDNGRELWTLSST